MQAKKRGEASVWVYCSFALYFMFGYAVLAGSKQNAGVFFLFLRKCLKLHFQLLLLSFTSSESLPENP